MLVAVAPVEGLDLEEKVAGVAELAAVGGQGGLQLADASLEGLVAGSVLHGLPGLAQGDGREIELIRRPVGVAELRPGPALQIEGLLKGVAADVEPPGLMNRELGELHHQGGIVVAHRPAPVEEDLDAVETPQAARQPGQSLQAALDEDGLPGSGLLPLDLPGVHRGGPEGSL